MDQAEEDDFYLNFAVPEESTNLWFDGWVMLKSGIGQDAEKQQAAEAFVNFVSRPDNAVRNMYYIGYTSVISGGDDDTVYDYLKWNYEAEDDAGTVTAKFTVKGDKITIKASAVDKAGNKSDVEELSFRLNANWLLRLYSNKPLFYSILAAILLAVAGVIIIIIRKKK